jgi:phage terminase large subunit GpA-like protein
LASEISVGTRLVALNRSTAALNKVDSEIEKGTSAEVPRFVSEWRPITGGVDVQKDRIEGSFVAWGPGEEAWLIDHVIIPGDTARPEPWAELAQVFGEFRPRAVAVDSGFNTSAVYEFVTRYRFCTAIKGNAGMGRPLVEDARKRAQRLRRRKGVHVEPIGVDGGKITIHSRLRQITPGPGYIHFPDDAAFDEEYFDQLAAEKLITRYRHGRPSREWQQIRPRNEALDCLVYALAALHLSGLRLDQPVAVPSQPAALSANQQCKNFVAAWNASSRHVIRRL